MPAIIDVAADVAGRSGRLGGMGVGRVRSYGSNGGRCSALAVVVAVVLTATAVLQAEVDPNESVAYPNGGYGLIICGNTHYGWEPYDQLSEELLRSTYQVLTQVYHFDPNKVWVLANDGEDDWTQGMFDPAPADKATVAEAFRVIGERMWADADTPRNLWVFIAGHGARLRTDPATKVQIRLADGPVYDHAFVDEIINQLHNNTYGSCPIDRLDLIVTPCYGAGLIDDLRSSFHNVRGKAWPNVQHLSVITAGDCYDMTAIFFAVPMLQALADLDGTVTDLDGDGVISIYERFDHAARRDICNPDRPYTPWVPDTIYVRGELYWIQDLDEHPIYYEWNGMTLDVKVNDPNLGHVTMDPPSSDPNRPFYSAGSHVTLTAVPSEGRVFRWWLIDDPNQSGDPHWGFADDAHSIVIAMNSNRHVTAVFLPDAETEVYWRILPDGEWRQCGAGAALPLSVLAACAPAMRMRRPRRR